MKTLLIVLLGVVALTSISAQQAGCPQICPAVYKPICASDPTGKETKVYSNECVFNAENCREAKDGQNHCQKFCPFNYQPICAVGNSGQQTFSNQCSLSVEQCKNPRSGWVKKHDGPCV